MKKTVSIFMILSLIMCMSLPCFAQSFEEEQYGMSFSLSDNWIKSRDYDGIAFSSRLNGYEYIYINVADNDMAYSMDLIDEAVLSEACHNMFSDWALAANLREANNNAFVTVKTDSELEHYEYHNGVKYFRYEKAYTASAIGYHDMSFYITGYATAKNGKIYLFAYERNSNANNFSDFVDMLNSISFEKGEVKIKINGERVYPDSAPMIIDGRTLVPIRIIAEKLGYTVSWDSETEMITLTASRGAPILHFAVGSDVAFKNYSQEIPLDVPAVIIEDRTYLPLRAVAEAMDTNVDWNSAENSVEITQ